MVANRRAQGFSHIITLLTLFVVAAVGFGGWYVGQHNKADNKEETSSNAENNADKKERPDPSDGGKYLVIKEWGVRIPLPADLQGDDVYYQLRQFEETYGTAEGADIGVKTFTPECLADSAGDLGLTIVRTPKELDATAPYIYKRNIVSNENGYWYHGAFGKDGCSKALTGEKAQQFEQLYESVGELQKY